jgi:hypothetical protein
VINNKNAEKSTTKREDKEEKFTKTIMYILMYLICYLPSAQQTVGYNWVYNDMFRHTRVILRLRSTFLNVFNDCVHFGIPKGLQCLPVINIQSLSEGAILGSQRAYKVYQLLTYNHYLKVQFWGPKMHTVIEYIQKF